MTTSELVKWIKALIQHKNIKAFYNSGEWLTERGKALERDKNECQKCKAKGGYHDAECVHHKKHVRSNPELALDLDNLISLCNTCHNEEHPEKFYKYKPKVLLNEERW